MNAVLRTIRILNGVAHYRLCALYERRASDRIFAVMDVPSRALGEFRATYPEGYCDYPDPAERIDFWDRLLRERTAIQDDSVPSASPI